MPTRLSIGRARRLRADQTIAEATLWLRLRNRSLDGFKFRRQFPVDRYIADFACLEARLIVELDGGQHSGAMAYDRARTEVLEHAGFRVLRIWNNLVLTEIDNVLQTIAAELQLARCEPLTFPSLRDGPLPLPPGEEKNTQSPLPSGEGGARAKGVGG